MSPEQLTAAGFRPCEAPNPFWPGDIFAPLYMRRLPQGSTLYVHCPLEHPDEVLAFVGDWSRPLRYCRGVIGNMSQLLHQLGLEESQFPA